MKCDFAPGDEVVCVSNECPLSHPMTHDTLLPTINRVYVVQQIEPMLHSKLAEIPGWEVGVQVDGIPPQCLCCSARMFFPHGWFRKVQKRSTEKGMEILREALREVERTPPAPVKKEDADA